MSKYFFLSFSTKRDNFKSRFFTIEHLKGFVGRLSFEKLNALNLKPVLMSWAISTHMLRCDACHIATYVVPTYNHLVCKPTRVTKIYLLLLHDEFLQYLIHFCDEFPTQNVYFLCQSAGTILNQDFSPLNT